jgi:tetratricopeptide (TPR) repeat protein
LENFSPEMRAHPDVFEIRWHVFARAKKWEACVDIASAIIQLAQRHWEGWIQCSFALHALKGKQKALDNLLPVADGFLGVWNIPYNLACYCAQLGRFDKAQDWFRRAMAVDEESVEPSAVDDPDLQPLWHSMNGTFWKRHE